MLRTQPESPTMNIPQRVLAAVIAIEAAHNAPPATPEPAQHPRGGVEPADRSRFTVILGWEPGYWRYDGDPKTGAVAAIPTRDGCASSRWGDRSYFRSAVFGWGRGRYVLTPEGVDFMMGESVS
jgi:hypothetical protein